MLTEALELYQALRKESDWTPFGRADLFGLEGETYRRKQEWENARQSYEHALATKPLPIHKVFLSQCLLQLQQHEKATKTLTEVNPEELSDGERIDYAFAFAVLAINTGDRTRLENAPALLKGVKIRNPLFREQRDSLLINVQEALTVGISIPLVQRTRGIFPALARFVSTYFVLKPSFMGIGLDVGKMLQDLSKRSERNPDRQPENDHKPGS
jgi:tetratricopeptide (TPR) repeat protein